jgi:hypothetical protein
MGREQFAAAAAIHGGAAIAGDQAHRGRRLQARLARQRRTLAGAFRAERLISEYIVSVVPLILGGGALFSGAGPLETLRLMNLHPYANDVLQLRYGQSFSSNWMSAAVESQRLPPRASRWA